MKFKVGDEVSFKGWEHRTARHSIIRGIADVGPTTMATLEVLDLGFDGHSAGKYRLGTRGWNVPVGYLSRVSRQTEDPASDYHILMQAQDYLMTS